MEHFVITHDGRIAAKLALSKEMCWYRFGDEHFRDRRMISTGDSIVDIFDKSEEACGKEVKIRTLKKNSRITQINFQFTQ
eukprot:UN25407